MADTTWPVTLPTEFDVNGYNEQEPNNIIRQSMAAGPDKVRRRGTSAPRPITGQMVFTLAQVEYMRTFYNDTTFSGTLTFDGLLEPRTAAAVDWRFMAPPAYVPHGNNGALFICTLTLEILP